MSQTNPHVQIECYGILQQVCGGFTREVRVAAWPVTVAEVLDGLVRDVPEMREYLTRTACAVGDAIVQRDAPLESGQTLVLLPPVSGG